MSDAHHIPSERIAELTCEPIAIVPYDERWPARYAEEEGRLLRSLPLDVVKRVAHIGSTSVPGLSAKPIIDIQVEVTDLDRVRMEVVPVMQQLGYEFIWRPTMGERAPYYAWFILRNEAGQRTVHVHMVEPDRATTDRLLFRDHLRAHPEVAQRYEALKQALVTAHPADRAAYTQAKTPFIAEVLQRARAEHPPLS